MIKNFYYAHCTGTTTNAARTNEIDGSAATKYCRDPNGVEGVCRNVKQCPIILKDFVRLVNQRDESYIRYIRQSNAICTTTVNNPIICCPVKRRVGSSIWQDMIMKTAPGKLPTPEEGCGLGKRITRPRTFNPGFRTKPGKFKWISNRKCRRKILYCTKTNASLLFVLKTKTQVCIRGSQ